jgi:chemotaxis-related protein WspB
VSVLFLLFELGTDRYALDVRQVAEVLPLLDIKRVPQTPPSVAGILNYRGEPVPVIDVSQLTLGRPAQRRLSTRVVLVHYPDADDQPRLLGLIAERATQTVRREETDFVASGVTNESAPYLGPVAPDARGLLQRLDVRTLLPISVRDMLFKQPRAQ